MNRNALSNLSRTNLQTLAKRDGLRAVGTTIEIIDRLVKHYEPLLVPYMDSIPATTEQESITQKMLRRQGLVHMPSASAPVRRSTRIAAHGQASASTSKSYGAGRAKQGAASSSVAKQSPDQEPSSPSAGVVTESASTAGTSRRHRTEADDISQCKTAEANERDASCHPIYTPRPSPTSTPSSSIAGSPAPLCGSPWKPGKVSEIGREEALLRFALKPVKDWGPLRETQDTGPSAIPTKRSRDDTTIPEVLEETLSEEFASGATDSENHYQVALLL
ncbi:hypothetical protein VTO73DRAFT_10688 [Trametes versicolor]